MAGVETPPYALQNASHGAQLFRLASGVWLGAPLPTTLTSPLRGPVSGSTFVQGSQQVAGSVGGVVGLNDFQITQNGTPNMTVNVAGGQIMIPGGSVANQGLYYGLSDATTNFAIATASASNPRIDTIIAFVEDAAYTGSNNDWKLQVVTGTATAGATLSNLTGAGSLASFPSCVVLGFVLVPTSATTIVTADILNCQPLMSPSFGGIDQRGNPAGTAFATTGTAVATTGVVGLSSSQNLRGGMAFSSTPGNTGLIIPVAGIYHVSGQVKITNAASNGMSAILFKNGSTATPYLEGNQNAPAAAFQASLFSGDVLCAIGDVLNLGYALNNNNAFQFDGNASGNYVSAHLVSV